MDGVNTVNLECTLNDYESTTWMNEEQLATATKL